jgi:hypothetical protein
MSAMAMFHRRPAALLVLLDAERFKAKERVQYRAGRILGTLGSVLGCYRKVGIL